MVADCATILPLEVFRQNQTLQRTCNFLSKFLRKKRQIWASEHHFGKVRSDTRPWLIARWKAHVRLSISVNWTVFAIYYGSGLWSKMCTARVYSQGSTFMHSTFIWTGSSTSTIFGIRKPEALCYQTVKTASFCVPSFWHNTGVWQTDGRTGRQMDMPPIAYAKLAKLG